MRIEFFGPYWGSRQGVLFDDLHWQMLASGQTTEEATPVLKVVMAALGLQPASAGTVLGLIHRCKKQFMRLAAAEERGLLPIVVLGDDDKHVEVITIHADGSSDRWKAWLGFAHLSRCALFEGK